MTSGLREPPTRLVARQVSELLLTREQRWGVINPKDRMSRTVLGVVAGASLAHLPYGEERPPRWIGIEAASQLGRPVNAISIAQSMRLPHTTVRRRAAELVGMGMLERRPSGFMMSAGFYAAPEVPGLLEADHRALSATISALAALGYDPAVRAATARLDVVPTGVAQRLLLAFLLRVLETFTEIYGDMTAGTLEAGIVAANVRHLTADPELGRLYAEDGAAPPDELRRPITVRALAKAVGLPFETVRRRIAGLVAEGIVVWREGGVVVPTRVLQSERHLRNNRRILGHLEHMLNVVGSVAAMAAETERARACDKPAD